MQINSVSFLVPLYEGSYNLRDVLQMQNIQIYFLFVFFRVVPLGACSIAWTIWCCFRLYHFSYFYINYIYYNVDITYFFYQLPKKMGIIIKLFLKNVLLKHYCCSSLWNLFFSFGLIPILIGLEKILVFSLNLR